MFTAVEATSWPEDPIVSKPNNRRFLFLVPRRMKTIIIPDKFGPDPTRTKEVDAVIADAVFCTSAKNPTKAYPDLDSCEIWPNQSIIQALIRRDLRAKHATVPTDGVDKWTPLAGILRKAETSRGTLAWGVHLPDYDDASDEIKLLLENCFALWEQMKESNWFHLPETLGGEMPFEGRPPTNEGTFVDPEVPGNSTGGQSFARQPKESPMQVVSPYSQSHVPQEHTDNSPPAWGDIG